MKANELRIGNIAFDTADRAETIITLDDFSCMGNYTRSGHPIPYATIRLTEEWLLKFGFMKINKNGDYKKDYYTCMIRKYHITFSSNHGYITNIEYVHQLQNLYFALTGEELTLKS